ncbi:MAG: oxidoreductase [Bacteroidetes bacterium]|nr:MAG: oxidoreductase [Bacteroidota bacterium]
MKELFPVTVKSNNEIAENAFLLKFRRNFTFTAGQVISITLLKNEESRLYSIASGEKHEEIWILYTIKTDGVLTPQLAKAKAGDTIYISKPFGNFICKEERAVWIATGTGIAPFASMFFSGQYHNKKLIQGNRSKQGLYFYEHIKEQMSENYLPCCSREPADGCFTGRVTQYIGENGIPDPGIPYYLCGSAEMVVDVRDLLIKKGVPFQNIQAEIFF